jgi:CBS domain-containing protein
MNLEIPIRELMIREVHTVSADQEINEAIALLRKYRIRHIPVVQGENIVGMLSRTDINRLTFGALFDTEVQADEGILDMFSISQVMTGHPRTVRPDQPLRRVAEIFSEEEYHALPVVEGDRLVGIVTTTDLIRHMLKYSED